MDVFRALFPEEDRTFPGRRWANITFRTLHLIGVSGLGGGFLYGVSEDLCLPFWELSVASGLALILLDLWTSAIWLIQLRGLAILLKIILLVCIPMSNEHGIILLVAIIVISSVVAHAPGDVRYYSIFHRKRLEEL